ncbi:MAG: hypothetical protein M8364_17360 [Methylobacter sp.]|uniref:hypothetical protein n=1 Tax=Methylobacter sp. TaxID=2051955 RepID=UPI002583AA61|nr:hypothetical protein [Methylobacter sp.]MCL7422661.1 hypothetical protein [Methylobacter sp.]
MTKNNNNRINSLKYSVPPWKISSKFILLISTGMLVSSWSYAAQDAIDKTSETNLQNKLIQKIAERDQVIADLQRRVQHLEQLVTAPDAGRYPSAQSPTTSTSAPERTASLPPANQPQAQNKSANKQSASSAPGSFEIDEDAAQRALERTLVQTGALLLPFGLAEIQPYATYTRREADTPILATAGGLVLNQRVRRDEIDAGATLLIGLPFESQAEMRIPGRFIEQSVVTSIPGVFPNDMKSSASTFGDVSVGIAKTLMHESDWLPDVIARFTWDSASGNITDNNISTGIGFDDFIGSLTFLKRQDPLAFTGRIAYQTSLERNGIEPGDQVNFSVSAILAASPQTSLNIGLQQAFIQETKINDIELPGSDGVSSAFTFGASSTIGHRLFFSVLGGIGLTESSPDYFLNVTIPFRFDIPFKSEL